jgi:hypothetical protein
LGINSINMGNLQYKRYNPVKRTFAGIGAIAGYVARPFVYFLNFATEGVSFDPYAEELLPNETLDEFISKCTNIMRNKQVYRSQSPRL